MPIPLPFLSAGRSATGRPDCAAGLGRLSVTAFAMAGALLALPTTLPAANPSTSGTAAWAAHLETRERIAADLQYLASDELRGRDTGSKEIDQAAEFIAVRFGALGLNTELFDGTPFQAFDVPSDVTAEPAEENQLSIRVGEAEPQVLEMDHAMRPLAIGGSGKAQGPLVFAGYGITAPEAGYDDYAGLDASGKIVVVLRGEPRRGRDDNPLGTPGPSRHAYFATKVQTAIEHGAAGLLVVNRADAVVDDGATARAQLDRQLARLEEIDKTIDALPDEEENSRKQLIASRELVRGQLEALQAEVEAAPEGLLGLSQAGQAEDGIEMPVVSLGRRAFARLVEETSPAEPARTLEGLEKAIDETAKPHSFLFPNVTVTLQTSLKSSEVRAQNVIAELPGRGALADQTLVIGAHYDHVGMGGSGSLAPGTVAVHNGADDNASGTALMLELAHRLSSESTESRRRILFMAFTGEERGLLGSKHYVRVPRFPLEETVAMINLDMVGRLNDDDGLTIYGTGTAAEFDSLIDQLDEQAELPVRKDPSGYGPSDHTSFYEKQVPVLFFFTGLHADYHRPSDDFEKINLDGMVRITDMVTQAARHLATVAERPVYQTTGPGGGIARNTQGAFLGVQLMNAGEGVVISETIPGGPAAQAGLQSGDQIVRIADEAIESLAAVQRTIARKKPDQMVEIVVLRGGREVTVETRLGKRP